ncbi:hypothetical protein N665_0159s0007 [Sinapis alba]|nr:hypothetical protein N665_0159s0007 [Sinapis alba]
MAKNKDMKLKRTIENDYGSSPEEGFKIGTRETRAQYRAMLSMYKEQTNALIAKHDEEFEVVLLQAKLELLGDLIELSALKSEKEKLEADLSLAQAKMADVRVPDIDWFKLGEAYMYD